MEGTTSIEEAKKIFGNNFIGKNELSFISRKISIEVPQSIASISFDAEYLKEKSHDYLLIHGASRLISGTPLTLISLRDHFGIDPNVSEPCFYNQDWYLNEDFTKKELESKWFLVKKSIFENSRAQNPDTLVKTYTPPSSVLCAYTFFICWYYLNEKLWLNDFIWCDDVDHNGDRVYVGRYHDVAGVNKNGFNIHRHLRIKNNYGCVEVI